MRTSHPLCQVPPLFLLRTAMAVNLQVIRTTDPKIQLCKRSWYPTGDANTTFRRDSILTARRYPQPSPVTTTSPAPGPIRYPSLMSQHQMKQGYVPSLHSMFQPPTNEPAPVAPGSLLFGDGAPPGGLYSNSLPQPSAPAPFGGPDPHRRQHSPNPPPIIPQPTTSSATGDGHRIIPASSNDLVSKELKTVYLPREALPRFLNVAAINTARNRETCGLLLGKDKRSRFVVTTLLIPKQHSTSDTCTMDEEELVMSFTEERALITLGWVCFPPVADPVSFPHVIYRYTPTPPSPVSDSGPEIMLTYHLVPRFHVVCRLAHALRFPAYAPRVIRGGLCSVFHAKVWISSSVPR